MVDNPGPQRHFTTSGEKILGIFAKEPLPGQVKTRLHPFLSPSETAEFHRLSLVETVAGMGGGSFQVVIFHTGDGVFFRRTFPEVLLLPQGTGDLGVRMARALRRLLDGGAGAAALIGSDAPDLPRDLVEKAFTALDRAAAVVVPARDGGYILVGARRPCQEIFTNIPWSTPEVMPATRRQAAEAGICLAETEEWEDVDDLPSLERLLARSPDSAAARYATRVLARNRQSAAG